MEGIKEVFEKITSYNIFNYLLPGVLFVFSAKQLTDHNLVQDNNLIGAFLYYFIGMVVSRFGSLLIEPFLKKIGFLKFSDYRDFVKASKVDAKIEQLSESNNTYRTIIAAFILLLLLKGYDVIKMKYGIAHGFSVLIAFAFVMALFLFSYRKQTAYISKRIAANINP